jgi:hypothetical protein
MNAAFYLSERKGAQVAAKKGDKRDKHSLPSE